MSPLGHRVAIATEADWWAGLAAKHVTRGGDPVQARLSQPRARVRFVGASPLAPTTTFVPAIHAQSAHSMCPIIRGGPAPAADLQRSKSPL